jgi:hypothetical protein
MRLAEGLSCPSRRHFPREDDRVASQARGLCRRSQDDQPRRIPLTERTLAQALDAHRRGIPIPVRADSTGDAKTFLTYIRHRLRPPTTEARRPRPERPAHHVHPATTGRRPSPTAIVQLIPPNRNKGPDFWRASPARVTEGGSPFRLRANRRPRRGRPQNAGSRSHPELSSACDSACGSSIPAHGRTCHRPSK